MATINTLISLALTATTVILCQNDFDDYQRSKSNIQPLGKLEPQDIIQRLFKTSFFRPIVGVTEEIFEYLHNKLEIYILSPRNVYFDYDDEENISRKFRECKLSTRNRLGCFLMQLK